MKPDTLAAAKAIHELATFKRDLEKIVDAIGDRPTIPPDEVRTLQDAYRDLKERVKSAAKRSPANPIEEAFFTPAVQQAAAYMTPPTNSHPLRSNWLAALSGPLIDFSHALHSLRAAYPDAS